MLAIAAIAVNPSEAMEVVGGTVGLRGRVRRAAGVIESGCTSAHAATSTGRAAGSLRPYIVGYSATTALWLISIFVPGPFRYALWTVAMADRPHDPHARVGNAQGPFRRHLPPHRTLRHVLHHRARRIRGGGGGGRAGFELTIESWIVGGLGFVIALCLWWIYFDLADTSVVGRGVLGLVYVYSHFPLLAGWRRSGKAASSQSRKRRKRPGCRGPMGAGRRNRGVRTVAGSAISEPSGLWRPQLRRPDRPRRPGPHAGGSWGRIAPAWFVALVCGRRARAATARGVDAPGRGSERLTEPIDRT